MNPRELVDVLVVMRGKAFDRLPWSGGPSAKRIALAPRQGGEQDLFTVSPALHKTVRELTVKLNQCSPVLTEFMFACTDHGIEREQ